VFPIEWADLGDDQGEMRYAPEPGGEQWIKVHQRFKGTDYAWLVLFHELVHAALAVSGTSNLIKGGNKGEETLVLSVEAVWQALVAVGKRASKRVGVAKSRSTRARGSHPRR
jgi:hypothetical protein